jgi:1-acyl-sn-glycerol-3-phosphate acyltransferase
MLDKPKASLVKMDNKEEAKPNSRRPLKTRDSAWAKNLSAWMAKVGVTANSISVASAGFASVGFLAFFFAGRGVPWVMAMVVVAVAVQLRLVCNLLDGMVAVEGGRKEAGGDILNEVPDRYSDIVLLVGAGIAAGESWLGWMAACAAVLTAYIRSFGAELTGSQDFSGLMAKPQRMFILTVGTLVATLYPPTLKISLWIVTLGAFGTAATRLYGLWEVRTGQRIGAEWGYDLLAWLLRLVCGLSAKAYQDPDPTKTHIYFSNHTSHLDALAIWSVLPRQCRQNTRPVAGRDYWAKNPWKEFLAVTIFRSILIEREKPSARNNPLTQILDNLGERESVIIFPEGTRGHGEIQDFKSGLYHLARKLPHAALIPVFVENLNRILPKGEFLPMPIVGRVVFGEAVGLGEGEGREEFLSRMKKIVCELQRGEVKLRHD